LAVGATGGATGETKTALPAQLPVAEESTLLGPEYVVPFHAVLCSTPSVVAYQRKPFATNMPLALEKLTEPLAGVTVIFCGLMMPPVTWFATDEAAVSGEK